MKIKLAYRRGGQPDSDIVIKGAAQNSYGRPDQGGRQGQKPLPQKSAFQAPGPGDGGGGRVFQKEPPVDGGQAVPQDVKKNYEEQKEP